MTEEVEHCSASALTPRCACRSLHYRQPRTLLRTAVPPCPCGILVGILAVSCTPRCQSRLFVVVVGNCHIVPIRCSMILIYIRQRRGMLCMRSDPFDLDTVMRRNTGMEKRKCPTCMSPSSTASTASLPDQLGSPWVNTMMMMYQCNFRRQYWWGIVYRRWNHSKHTCL
jgi:hypothetical protein